MRRAAKAGRRSTLYDCNDGRCLRVGPGIGPVHVAVNRTAAEAVNSAETKRALNGTRAPQWPIFKHGPRRGPVLGRRAARRSSNRWQRQRAGVGLRRLRFAGPPTTERMVDVTVLRRPSIGAATCAATVRAPRRVAPAATAPTSPTTRAMPRPISTSRSAVVGEGCTDAGLARFGLTGAAAPARRVRLVAIVSARAGSNR